MGWVETFEPGLLELWLGRRMSTMRPKVFHGTNSITCAKSVLPTFMRYPRSVKPESFANSQIKFQIVDTHESLATRFSIGFARGDPQMNRTLLI